MSRILFLATLFLVPLASPPFAASMAESSPWYSLDVSGRKCIKLTASSSVGTSPAFLVEADRALGLEDLVVTLKRDNDGKPLVVTVNEPEGNGMMTQRIFFRGPEDCEGYLKERGQELENLR